MPIASPSDPHASQDQQPNARIAASSKDIFLVRPTSKLCGKAFCNPRRADGTQQCALSHGTTSPSPAVQPRSRTFDFGAFASPACGIARPSHCFPQGSRKTEDSTTWLREGFG